MRTPLVILSLLLGLVPASRAAATGPAVMVYPGSFDPFHLAHKEELLRAAAWLRAQHPEGIRVVVVPNHDRPRHVPDGYTFDADKRQRLATLSLADHPEITVHAPFEGNVDTAEQLARVAAEHPGAKPYLLLGHDAYEGLARWPEHEGVLARFHVVVSAPPPEFARLAPPEQVLGVAGAGYARPVAASARSSSRFVAPDGRAITYLSIRVPRVRGRTVLMALMAGTRVTSLVGPAVARELLKRAYRGAIERLAQRSLGQARHLGLTFGPKAARAVTAHGGAAAQVLGADPTLNGAAIAQLAHAVGAKVGMRISPQDLARYVRSRDHRDAYYPRDDRPRHGVYLKRSRHVLPRAR